MLLDAPLTKSQKVVIVISGFWLLISLMIGLHAANDHYSERFRVAEFLGSTLAFALPVLLYWSGVWIWGHGYILRAFGHMLRSLKNFFCRLFSNPSALADGPVLEKKQKNKRHWLLWWKIDPAELETQLLEYDTLKFYNSARGLSVILLLLSAVMTSTLIFLRSLGADLFNSIDVAIFLFLALFIYKKRRWAMVGAMFVWSLEKAFTLFDYTGVRASSIAPHIFMTYVWWSVYMHAFYLAYTVEKRRTLSKYEAA